MSFTLIVLWVLSLITGSTQLDWDSIFRKETTDSVIFQFRLQKSITASLVGIALPLSGMLLQEYFKNVLAGPSVMGISSAAGLGVACIIFLGLPTLGGAQEWWKAISFTLAALIGSAICLFLLLFLSRMLKEASHLIIIGFLISALCAAIISVMQLYSGNAELKQFVLWTFGSFSNLSWTQIIVFLLMVVVGILLSWQATGLLQGSILGDLYAQSVGVNLQKMKWQVLVSTSLLTGVCTAMVGPIAFAGIIVPFLSRMWISEAYLHQQLGLNILLGMNVMLGIGIISELIKLPINIIMSFLGIPLIAYIVLQSAKQT